MLESITVRDGVISVTADAARRVTYGELIGGRRFDVTLTGNNPDQATGRAPLKRVQDFRIVGQSPQRYDIPPKVDGSLEWAVDAKVPGMVHARNVRPPSAGATLGTDCTCARASPAKLHDNKPPRSAAAQRI